MLLNRGHAKCVLGAICVSSFVLGATPVALADALSSNNSMYPNPEKPKERYSGAYNLSNLDYPETLPEQDWVSGAGFDEINQSNAKAYMDALKAHLKPSIRILVQEAQSWDAAEQGWYNMVWRGAGDPSDPTSGREPIMNTNTGQIVPSESWREGYRPTTEFMQNYGVIYYNGRAAYTLGQVWKDIYNPVLERQNFPEGSIVVKVEAATVNPSEWPWDDPASGGSVLNGAAEWQVFRPTTESQKKHQRDPSHKMENEVQTVHPFQLAIKVKDSVAAPKTGWVFLGYVFDARQSGEVWDKFVPAGMMWGNDPDHALSKTGITPDDKLEETWVNPDAPPFVHDTLGWGGRMAAPMDVALRHNVIFPDGTRPEKGLRVSSCLSCHGTAQFPFTANLYPSPNRFFPPDGEVTFPLYSPGSPKWAEWFKNRPGDLPQSNTTGVKALDYDLTSMIALGIWAGVTGKDALAFDELNGH
ncbi:MAG: hypothetical protein AAF230_02135 [Pseudomonadota bacterium]